MFRVLSLTHTSHTFSFCVSMALQTVNSLQSILENTLPLDEIVYSFGYGSGVFEQSDNKQKPLVDLIVAVKDTNAFHSVNVQQNPSHYWIPRSTWASWIQKNSLWGSHDPGVGFQVTPHCKYGVVHWKDLLDDLQEWKYLYLAGRLHKPTVTLPFDSHEGSKIHKALQEQNLPGAVAAALLLSDEIQGSENLYETIASLSYAGDFRMAVAENPHKIRQLVHSPGQLERFEKLYQPSLQRLEEQGVLSRSSSSSWEWDSNALAKLVPVVGDQNSRLEDRLSRIVSRAARVQAIKGVWTVGPRIAVEYARRKLAKGPLFRKA